MKRVWRSFSLDEQWAAGLRQLDPKGPAQTDFFRLLTGAQGSYGIVTWASVKCELLPTAQKFLFVTADKLESLVDLMYRLTRLRLADELLIVNNSQLAALVGTDAAEIAALKQELPLWTLVMGVGGRALLADERVDATEKDIAEVVSGFGLRILPGLSAPGYVASGAGGRRYLRRALLETPGQGRVPGDLLPDHT